VNKHRTPSYHLWLPGLGADKGGIQTYSSFFLEALVEVDPIAECAILSKHDRTSPPCLTQLDRVQFYGTGGVPLPFRTAAFAAQLWWRAWQQRPDLIITTHLNFAPVADQLKGQLGIPYWVVAHGVEAWNLSNPRLQGALHHADRILAVSHYTRDRLLEDPALDPARVVVLPNTVASDRFTPGPKPPHLLAKYGLTADQPIILTVARLSAGEQYKGYDKILAALPQIRQQIPQVHYLLVGKGEDQARVRGLVEAHQLQDCVTLTGFIPDGELADHYRLCDVFAMPSKGEGFGIVYLEALACGKPTLGGNQDGALDALCRGELGALVDPDDVQAIAHTLVEILQGTYPNPLIYQPEQLRQRVIDIYGFERFKRTLKGYLDDFMETGI
jgi:glycosyltransferase involved in cell wall biosynthesis